VVTVGDLARLDVETLRACVGTANGTHLHQLANGIDHRGVEPDRDLKSIGHEETFPADISDRRRLERELAMLSEAVGRRLGAAEVSARTVTIKIRFADFATISRSFTSGVATDSGMEIGRRAVELFGQVDISSGVRLVGVSTSGLVSEQVEQLALDVAAGDAQIEQGAGPRRQEADRAIDEIRDRFGTGAIAMGLSADGFDTHRPIWGPDERGEPDGP